MADTADLTVEQAASQFEGLLSAEDGTQEPEEKEAAKATDSEASDDSEEGEPEPEAEESEDEEPEEEPEAPQSFTVKVDGKEQKVPLQELINGYQRTADYTRKTQQLAEERRELEAVKAEREHYTEMLGKVEAMLKQNAPAEPDWDKLLAENPVEYLRQQRMFQQRHSQAEAVKAESERAKAAQEAEEAKGHAEYLTEQQDKLLKAIPDWKDAKKASIEKAKLIEHGSSYGYTPEELGQVSDARAVMVLRDAANWREHLAKQSAIKPTFKQPSVKTARGGTSQQTPANSVNRDMKRLRQTGDVDDAAAVFMHFVD